jgi:hypothetical protein
LPEEGGNRRPNSAQRYRYFVLCNLQSRSLVSHIAIVVILVHSLASITFDLFDCLTVDSLVAVLSSVLTSVWQSLFSRDGITSYPCAADDASAQETVAALID